MGGSGWGVLLYSGCEFHVTHSSGYEFWGKGDWKIHEHLSFMNNGNSTVILVVPWEHFELSEVQDINGKSYIFIQRK